MIKCFIFKCFKNIYKLEHLNFQIIYIKKFILVMVSLEFLKLQTINLRQTFL